MEIFINDKIQEIPEQYSITDTLLKIGVIDQNGIAIAVNNCIVSKLLWAKHILLAGDKITLIRATQGG